MAEQPLTLRLEREDHDDGSITYHLWDGAGHWIVGLNDDPASQGGAARSYAKTIVRAVNSHEALVEACREALRFITNIDNAHASVRQLRAALSTAESGE